MAIKEFNVDLDVKGRVLASTVPNSTGSIVTWNTTTNVFGLRTNAQIISDLNLSSNFVPYTGATANVNLGTRSITSTGGFIGNATTSTTLATARTINGTSFNGSADITTANWGTARNITIGNTTKAVNGSANVSWSLAEIGVTTPTLQQVLTAGDSATRSINLSSIGTNQNYFKHNYVNSASGGWARTAFVSTITNPSTSEEIGSFRIGAYGTAQSLNYYHIGTGGYSSGTTFRWYPEDNGGIIRINTRRIPLSVNGTFADASGNIGISVPTSSDFITTNTNQTGLTGNKTSNGIWTLGQVRKAGQSDTQMLLAGGGHRPVSDFALEAHTHTFASLTSKPTTIAGYGITDFNSLGDARWALRTRTISAGTGLTGGGNLTANRTIGLSTATQNDITKGVTANGWGDFRDWGLGNTQAKELNDLGAVNNDINTLPRTVNAFIFPGPEALNVPGVSNDYPIGLRMSLNVNIGTTLLFGRSGNDKMWFRNDRNGVGNFNPWREVYHSGNFTPSNYYTKTESNNRFVTLDGVQTIAKTKTFTSSPVVPNGTIDGHAVNLGQANTRYAYKTHSHGELLVPTITDLNTTVNATANRFTYNIFRTVASNKQPGSNNNANGILTMQSHSGVYAKQIAFGDNHDLYMRRVSNGNYGEWKSIWHTGNLANGTTSQYIRGDGSLATYANTTYNVFTRTANGLVPRPTNTTTTRYLREDGTWVVPPNSNTTYSTGTLAQLNAGTDTTGRLQTAKLLNDWLNGKANATGTVANSLVRRDGLKINTSGGFFETSDRRLKTSIKDIGDTLNKVLNVPTVSYNMNKQDSIGTIAQDVQEIFPELVNTDEDGMLSVNYAKLSIVAIKAIKELKEELNEVKRLIHE